MSPFDFLNSINHSKKDIMTPENEHEYAPYMVNRGLSYFNDTILYANIMNRYHKLDNRLQFDFLLNTVRERKRFSKWMKVTANDDVDLIKEYYGYSNEKAMQVLPLLSQDQLNKLKEKV